MTEIIENQESLSVRNRSVHMANERTFLAWIRTSIGIMAFGFVVEKFTLFIKQMSLILGQANIENTLPPSQGYSAIIGIFLVGFGAIMCVLAFIRYMKIEKQIDKDTYKTSYKLDLLLTISVLGSGIFLVIYLISNI